MAGAGANTGDVVFFKRALHLLDSHLQKDSQRLAVLAAGGAFESWLALETRLLFEKHRSDLDLRPAQDLWIATEWTKTDLSIGTAAGDACHSIFEFKIVYNNKNWASQIDGIRNDLHPGNRTRKGRLRPSIGRIAIVALVGKLYRQEWASGYDQPRDDLARWIEDVLSAFEENAIRVFWKGPRHRVTHPYLREKPRPFVQILGLAPVVKRSGS